MSEPHENPYRSPEAVPASTPRRERDYAKQVLWYRRSDFNNLCMMLGLFCFPPLLWTACIIILTGDVYLEGRREDGSFKTWSVANKAIALIVLAAHTLFLYALLAV